MRLSSRHDTTVVMVGDSKVGKSALVNKFRCGKFETGYNKTNFDSHTTSSIIGGQRVKFTIYDTSGMKIFDDTHKKIFVKIFTTHEYVSISLYRLVYHRYPVSIAVTTNVQKLEFFRF